MATTTSPLRSAFAALILSLAFLPLLATGCTAEAEIKQGALGEYCNGFSDDCRPGLACINSVCQGMAYESNCAAICGRLEECGRFQPNCSAACDNTIRQWGVEPVEDFTACMSEDLSCEELQEVDEPPQECYNRLALPTVRAERCEDFIVAANDCEVSSTTELRRECRYMGRTRAEEHWAYSDECVDRVTDGVCDDILDCFTEVFNLETAL